MSTKLPVRVEPFRFAEQGRTVSGMLPLAKMARLLDAVDAVSGEAQVALTFGKDTQGRYRLTGHAEARVELTCQRCMAPLALLLQSTIDLLIVHSEAEGERLGETEDLLIVSGENITLAEVVEDELLLALPVFAKHAEGTCEAAWQAANKPAAELEVEQPKRNPFAVLGELKKH